MRSGDKYVCQFAYACRPLKLGAPRDDSDPSGRPRLAVPRSHEGYLNSSRVASASSRGTRGAHTSTPRAPRQLVVLIDSLRPGRSRRSCTRTRRKVWVDNCAAPCTAVKPLRLGPLPGLTIGLLAVLLPAARHRGGIGAPQRSGQHALVPSGGRSFSLALLQLRSRRDLPPRCPQRSDQLQIVRVEGIERHGPMMPAASDTSSKFRRVRYSATKSVPHLHSRRAGGPLRQARIGDRRLGGCGRPTRQDARRTVGCSTCRRRPASGISRPIRGSTRSSGPMSTAILARCSSGSVRRGYTCGGPDSSGYDPLEEPCWEQCPEAPDWSLAAGVAPRREASEIPDAWPVGRAR